MPQSGSDHPPPLDREAMARLVERVATGDREAFAALFQVYAPKIKGYLLRLGAPPAQAEELAQDVMITVWQKAGQFDSGQASVSTWLYTIARNRRIDVIRRERRPEFDPEDPLLVPEPEVQPDAALTAADREARLHAAMKDLPEEQARLLRQAFFEAKSHSEIAAVTGLPLGTVKSRLRLAFARLKKALEGEV